MNEEEKILVSKEVYEELLHDAKVMKALRAAGVDNWEGFDHAIDLLDETY